MEAQQEVLRLLNGLGARIVSTKKHMKYELPGGHVWVTPKTASDHRAWENNLSGLRRKLFGTDSTPKTYSTQNQRERRKRQREVFQPFKFNFEPANVTTDSFSKKVREALFGPTPKPTTLAAIPESRYEMPAYRKSRQPSQHGRCYQYSPDEIALINRANADHHSDLASVVYETVHNKVFDAPSMAPQIQLNEDDLMNIAVLNAKIDSWQKRKTELLEDNEKMMAKCEQNEKDANELTKLIEQATTFSSALASAAGILNDPELAKATIQQKKPQANAKTKTGRFNIRLAVRTYFDSLPVGTTMHTNDVIKTISQTHGVALNKDSVYQCLFNLQKEPGSVVGKSQDRTGNWMRVEATKTESAPAEVDTKAAAAA